MVQGPRGWGAGGDSSIRMTVLWKVGRLQWPTEGWKAGAGLSPPPKTWASDPFQMHVSGVDVPGFLIQKSKEVYFPELLTKQRKF